MNCRTAEVQNLRNSQNNLLNAETQRKKKRDAENAGNRIVVLLAARDSLAP
jgi:hypothetical protein